MSPVCPKENKEELFKHLAESNMPNVYLILLFLIGDLSHYSQRSYDLWFKLRIHPRWRLTPRREIHSAQPWNYLFNSVLSSTSVFICMAHLVGIPFIFCHFWITWQYTCQLPFYLTNLTAILSCLGTREAPLQTIPGSNIRTKTSWIKCLPTCRLTAKNLGNKNIKHLS